jgi:hypothetical protein
MRLKKITAATAAEASAKYCALRDRAGAGASQISFGVWEGNLISYNGKVWPGLDMNPSAEPLFVPAY